MSADSKPVMRCAIYARKSSEEGLEQSFNSLDAQREACEAFILSQRHEGWRMLPARDCTLRHIYLVETLHCCLRAVVFC